MQQKAFTLAMVALLALGTSGVVAASISTSPQTGPTGQSFADEASPGNYTVDVIDPTDRLTDRDVATARQLAATNDAARSHVDGDTPVHFQVEALGDELQVYVAPNETAPPRVLAVVDLASESVVSVEELENVVQAEETQTMEAPLENRATTSNDGTNGTHLYTDPGAVVVTHADELIEERIALENVTAVEDGESLSVADMK